MEQVARRIGEEAHKKHFAGHSLLVAISGIDGSGKSTIAFRLVQVLRTKGFNTVMIGLDNWHNPPQIRFSGKDPGEHFYNNAFRFEELFQRLINPLKKNRSIQLSIELTRLPQNDTYWHNYDFQDVQVIVLEGIFLLKRELMDTYDLTYWIDCSFETALKRAIRRNQEGLSPAEIIRDYQTIYFPAQEIHLLQDDPTNNADGIIKNDQHD